MMAPPTSKPTWRWKSAISSILSVGLTYLAYRCFLQDQLQSGTYGCEMSYMWPTYHQVDWPDNPSAKYSLHLYREQGWEKDDRPSGHPVIFIPGNAGSYKQVRSIASSASRQYYTEDGQVAQGMEDKTSLDFFAVDYNEDFSAFHAPTLADQAAFLAHSVRQVLRQYHYLPSSRQPKKVTLLGHSMGGVVARLALNELPKLVDVIMTMSTPHALPPVTLSKGMDILYGQLQSQIYNESSPLLFSICGGTADTQIASDTCVIPRDTISRHDGFTIFTTAMPGAWTGVEHQTMVWCHQVRWRVARTLLDMTSTSSRRHKLGIAEEWLLGQKHVTTIESGKTKSRIPVTSTSMSIKVSSGYDAAAPLQWCRDESTCQALAANITILPAPKNIEAPFPVPGEGIQPDEHVSVINVKLPEPSGYIEIHANDPVNIISVGSHQNHSVNGRTWTADQNQDAGSHLTLRFERSSTSSLVVHRLKLKFKQCQGHRPTIRYRVRALDDNDTTHESRFYPNVNEVLYLHAHSGSSPYLPRVPSGFDIDIYQDVTCPVHRAKLSIDYGSSLAKMVTRYRMAALAWIFGWVAVVIYRSAEALSHTVPSTADAVEHLLYPIAFVITSYLMATADGAGKAGWYNWYLGVDISDLNASTAILAIWSFGVVTVLSGIISLMFSITKSLQISKRSPAGPTPISLWSVLMTAGPFLTAVHFVIPHQMAFVILFLVLLATVISEERHSSRFNLMTSLVLLLTVLIPFNAPVLAVWGRNIWADYRNPFPGDFDALRILPLLTLIWLLVSGRPIKSRPGLASIIKWTSISIALLAFTFGGRRTWIIPPMVNILYLQLACLFL